MSQTRRCQRIAQANKHYKEGNSVGGIHAFLLCPSTRERREGVAAAPTLNNKASATPSFTCCISWRYASGRQIAADVKKIPETVMPWRPSNPVFGDSKIHTSRRNRRIQRLSFKNKRENKHIRKIVENFKY
jgi:hypothetical protein